MAWNVDRPLSSAGELARRTPRTLSAVAAWLLWFSASVIEIRAQGPVLREPLPGSRDFKDSAAVAAQALARAEKEKDQAAAERAVLRALEFAPEEPAFLRSHHDLLPPKSAARALAALRLVQSGKTPVGRGAAALARERALQKEHPWLKPVVTAQEALLGSLAKAWRGGANKASAKGGRPLRRLLAELLAELGEDRPQLAQELASSIAEELRPKRPDHRPILSALKDLMDKALSQGDAGLATDCARTLLGFASQARFPGLPGEPAPDLTPVQMAGSRGLQEARRLLGEADGPKVWTIEALRELEPLARDAFQRTHSNWRNPGIALSPTGLYRIETICGYETLLGVAETIEKHHRRLVAYFGKDPFLGRQGIVRVVPGAEDLEAEGAPHWWAGGFQSGDVTVARFSSGTIEGLGRTLTHELTHRFDRALFGAKPSWYLEGHAVWTASAYAHSSDETLVLNFHDVGDVESAFIKQYTQKDRLEKLLTQTLDDYRDNYPVGYALLGFLRHWPVGGEPIFAARFREYQEKDVPLGGPSALQHFVQTFADGKEGRPEGLDGFLEPWREWLRGHYWQSRASWLERFTTKHPRIPTQPVFDPMTWEPDRVRAEPAFGQIHAYRAADLLWAAGNREVALSAYAFSLEVDELDAWQLRHIAARFHEAGEELTAYCLLVQLMRRGGEAEALPLPKDFPAAAELSAYAQELTQQAAASRERGEEEVALLFEAMRARLGPYLAMMHDSRVPPEAANPSDQPAPVRAELLALRGFVEDRLFDFEERRVSELWSVDERGDLTIGRKGQAEGVTGRVREARERDAFARSRAYFAPGRYRVSFRLHPETSFVDGAIVFGHTRRDRDLRLHFSGGDYYYAIGVSKEELQFEKLAMRLESGLARSRALPGFTHRVSVPFATGGNSVFVEILVNGPEAQVFVDGRAIANAHRADGLAIEGFVGFAAARGVYRVTSLKVAREEYGPMSEARVLWQPGLDLNSELAHTGDELLHRRTKLPTGATGALWLIIPPLTARSEGAERLDDESHIMAAVEAVHGLARALSREDYPQKAYLAVPKHLREESISALKEQLKKVDRGLIDIVYLHAMPEGLEWEPGSGSGAKKKGPTLCYLDARGVLRASAHYRGGNRLPREIETLLQVARLRPEDRFAAGSAQSDTGRR